MVTDGRAGISCWGAPRCCAGWEFDVRTGQSWCEPGRIQPRQYPVDVAAGTSLGKGPHVAQSIPVAVAVNYGVVEV